MAAQQGGVNRRGIDNSNYAGLVSVARYQTLYDQYAVRFNAVGCQIGADGANWTAPQIANSKAAGLEVPFTYDFLFYAGEDGSQGVERMKHAAGFGHPVAPDIDAAMPPGGAGRMLELMAHAKDQLEGEGLFWGWYSSPPEWQRLTGNTLAFAGDRGWTAAYPFSTPTQAVLPPVDYMPDFARVPAFGQTLPIVWQYADICYGEPAGFDMDAWNPAYVDGGDQMIRHNATSAWYEDPAHQAFTGTTGINCTVDLALPADAVAVQLEVTAFPDSSPMQARDGNEGLAQPAAFDILPPALYFAGRVEVERIDAAPGLPDAWCHLAAQDVGHIRHISCVGFYRA